MYQQRPTTFDLMLKQGCKAFCATFLFTVGFISLIIGIVFYVALKKAVNEGFGFLIAAAIMIAIGILLCCNMHSNAAQEMAELPEPTPLTAEPLVSGCAPPGAISGFHIEARQQQPSHPNQRYAPQDCEPLRTTPSAPEELPPSYHDVVKTH